MEVTALPPELEHPLARFSDESWRERKQAVKDLQAALARQPPSPAIFEALLGRLLDGLTAESVPARSTCHEMLVFLGPRGLDGVLRRLQAGGRGTRMYVDLLADIGAAEHVPLLTDVLCSADDDNVRASAAAALGAIGGPEAEAALHEILAGSSEMLQLFALDALRSIGAALSVATLLPLVDNAVTRRAATSLLGHSATPEALDLLVPLLRDSMPGVRAAAAVALVTLDAGLADRPGHRRDAVAAALAGSSDDAVRERMRELALHRQTEVKIAALELCRMTRDAGAMRHVLSAMSDPIVRERAADFVVGLGAEAGPALQALAADVPPASLGDFYTLIGALGPGVPPALEGSLVIGLAHPDAAVACVAAGALGRVGEPGSMHPLIAALAAADPLGEAVAAALVALVDRHGTGVPGVQTLLRDAGVPAITGLRARNLCRVLGALGRGGDRMFVPPLVTLLATADPLVRVAAARALGQIGGEHEGVSALTRALADGDPGVRASACRSLGKLGAASACQALLAVTADDSAQVRAAAVQALVSLDDPAALPRLREVVLADTAAVVVLPAIAGLGRAGGEVDLTLLMTLCRSSDHEVAKAAARALVRFPAHRATAAVLGLLDHERWDVRWAAAEVLAERGDLTALGPLRQLGALEKDALVRQVLASTVARLEGLAAASGAEQHP